MINRIKSNEAFQRNIYNKGSFQGHGFVCTPKFTTAFDAPGGDYTNSNDPIENWVPWVVENYERQIRMNTEVDDDCVPVVGMNTGTHIYAAAFGCSTFASGTAPVCSHPLVFSAGEADKLEVPDFWSSPTLYRYFELARAVQKELGNDVFLRPPDMQTGFDTAAMIWDKTDLMCAMMDEDEKDAVKRLSAKCAKLYKQYMIELRKEFPSLTPAYCPTAWAPPEMGPWIANDECGSISTEMFEEFCLPELIDLSETFGGLGMHCCAAAEHQFESFKKIPNFYAFNRVAASQGYMPLLDQLAGNDGPVHVISWIPEEHIEELIRKASEGTRFIFVLAGATIEEGKAWLERMRKISPRTDRQ